MKNCHVRYAGEDEGRCRLNNPARPGFEDVLGEEGWGTIIIDYFD